MCVLATNSALDLNAFAATLRCSAIWYSECWSGLVTSLCSLRYPTDGFRFNCSFLDRTKEAGSRSGSVRIGLNSGSDGSILSFDESCFSQRLKRCMAGRTKVKAGGSLDRGTQFWVAAKSPVPAVLTVCRMFVVLVRKLDKSCFAGQDAWRDPLNLLYGSGCEGRAKSLGSGH